MALRLGVIEQHLGPMLARNFLNDGQAQARTIRLRPEGTIKRLKYQLG